MVGGMLSVTVTRVVQVLELPEPSVAVHVTVVTPLSKVLLARVIPEPLLAPVST